MPFTAREVLVPLIGQERDGALCRLAADGDLPDEHPAHLDRAISDLLETGLYQAGQQARAAVRRLHIDRGWLRRPAPVALSVVNPGDVIGLAPDNAASAELGLALAMLMFAAQTRQQTVIATGTFDVGSADLDEPIRPIHHMDAKFRVVEEHFRQPGIGPPPTLFFTPRLDADGVAVAERHHEAIARLLAVGIKVVPVPNLRAAAAEMGALRLRPRGRERVLRAGMAGAALLAIVGIGAGLFSVGKDHLARRPITIQPLAAATPDGGSINTPARFRPTPTRQPRRQCRSVNGLPLYAVGDLLFLKLRSADDEWLDRVGKVYYTAIVMSQLEGRDKPSIVVRRLAGRAVAAGEEVAFEARVAVGDELLVVLATRFEDFDRNTLSMVLHARLDPLNPDERVDAARNFVRIAAPGAYVYRFATADREDACLNE